jgi:hypothetical protein
MNDAILGQLAVDKRRPTALKGTVPYQGAQVALDVDPDDGGMAECLELARVVVADLEHIDEKARQAAARDLLSNYNKNWREYERSDGKGGFIRVSGPELTEEQFSLRIKLNSLSITGSKSCCFGYDDGELFWGHGIFVTSFDGIEFSNVHVELFG